MRNLWGRNRRIRVRAGWEFWREKQTFSFFFLFLSNFSLIAFALLLILVIVSREQRKSRVWFSWKIKMESSSRSRSHAGSIEENTMAIIDAAGAKDTQDTNDDRTCRYSIESWNFQILSFLASQMEAILSILIILCSIVFVIVFFFFLFSRNGFSRSCSCFFDCSGNWNCSYQVIYVKFLYINVFVLNYHGSCKSKFGVIKEQWIKFFWAKA